MSPLLPENLEADLDATLASEIDEITDLQGRLKSADDALIDAQNKVRGLEAKVIRLQENAAIKRTAVNYAKISLVIIPLSCLLLLLLSAMGERTFNFCGSELDLSIDLNNYAQAALIVAPIAFFATIIGFLLKGVFGQSVDVKDLSASDVMKALDKGD